MTYPYSVILTYKGKVLLFSRDILIETNEKNSWDFFRTGKQKNKNVVDFLRKEMSLTTKYTHDVVELTHIAPHKEDDSQLFHFRLTDENVNGIKRKEGWRLEFYRFNELDKISLSDEARNIFNRYNEQIKELIAS